MAMPVDLTDDRYQRTYLMSFRICGTAAGQLVAGALAPLLVDRFGGGRAGFATMAWVGVMILIACSASFPLTAQAGNVAAHPHGSHCGDEPLRVGRLMRRLLLLVLLLLAPYAPASAIVYTMVQGAGGVPLLMAEGGNPRGPEILFIHGMSQSHLAWLPQFDSDLARTHRLVAFDMRGHGGSGKPWRPEDYAGSRLWADDIAAVIAAAHLRRPTIVTWSFGGHAAIAYIRHYGTAHVGALNLAGTLAGLIDVPRHVDPEYAKVLDGSRLRSSLDLAENIAGYRAMAAGFSARPLPQQQEETAFLTGLMHPSYVRRAMQALPTKNVDMASRIGIPVLITLGDKDLEWPLTSARALAKALPNARLSIYPGFGHFPSSEDPVRFNRELAGLTRQADDPLGLVGGFIDAHNHHDVESAMAFYAEDATFFLNDKRPPVRGHDGITALEAFDSAAGSHVEPRHLRVLTDPQGRVVVSLAGVVEHSRVFAAMGLETVTTEPQDAAFVITNGRFDEVRQPSMKPSCRRVAATAFSGAADWLSRSADSRAAALLTNGRPRLSATTIPAWLEALRDWRQATGWAPAAADVKACATVDF